MTRWVKLGHMRIHSFLAGVPKRGLRLRRLLRQLALILSGLGVALCCSDYRSF